MNYRHVELLGLTTISADQTQVLDIDLADPISRIILDLRVTNGETNRNVCIRTLDYIIARLKNADMIVRKMRTKDAGVAGKQFDTSLTELTNRGLYEIRKFGVRAFEIMERIRASPKKAKKKSHTVETGRVGSGSTGQVGEVLKEELEKIKPP